MAIFETPKDNNSNKEYVGLMDTHGELVAFISPVKGVSSELIVEALKEKGLKAELRQVKEDRLELKL